MTGTLQFNPGQSSTTVTVAIVDDQVGEYTENIALELSDPSEGAVQGRPGVAVLQNPG